MNRKPSRVAHFFFSIALVAAASSMLAGQDYSQRTRALDQADSRAEKEAEQMVSLPPEKIIAMLQQEPGLFLEVKKMLVRKAFDQGRLVEAEELTDEAVFRLVREDENTRALITHEIEDRSYIKAKPTREELEKQYRRPDALVSAGMPTPSVNGSSQEDAYWAQQSRSLQQRGQPSNPLSPSPNAPLTPNNPNQTTPSTDDARRQQLLAQGGDQGTTDYSGGTFDTLAFAFGGGQGIGAGQQGAAQQLGADQLAMSGAQGGSAGSTSLNPTSLTSSPSENTDPRQLLGPTGNGAVGNSPSSAGPAFGSTPDLSGADEAPRPKQASLESQPGALIPPLEKTPRQDRPVLQHRVNPYADVPSLYDLYSQYQQRSPTLTRFGSEIFENGTGNAESLPMDLPVGPDYVLGPGDGLNIDLWGSISQRLRRVVDTEGRISLPEVGTIEVSGRTLGEIQHTVQTALGTQLKGIQADLSLSRLRTVRIYVVGDVQRPGAYDISSLSTPLNALYQAGGPTSRGSLRLIKHFRGKELVEEVDLYDLLLHGVHGGMQRLQSGDSLLVPPAGAEVTIQGMVRRPGIYELNGEKNLAQVLELSGGVLPSGTLRHVDVERVEAHESRTMLRLDVPENNNQASVTQALEDFAIQDGDQVKISPILPFADKTVYLEGHVFRPGKFAYQDGMKVTDLIHSYKDLLPEPYDRHAEIVRLVPPDNKPEVLAFNLGDALSGKGPDISLKPFDTVRVFGRYDFEDPPVVTVTGEVRDPGDHVTNGATYLRDAIYLAGNTNTDAALDDVQVFRSAAGTKLEVFSVSLQKALAGDPTENILLQPKDRVFIHRDLSKTDPPKVTIEGEVGRPGKYPLGADMTAAELVRLAGGLKRSAYAREADLTRYYIEQGSKVEGEHISIPIADALAGKPDTDVRLHDGDVLTIRQLTGWNDLGAKVEVKGEVIHPGTYGIEEGERLSQVLERAGGFRSDAYPYGAVLERVQVRDMEEKHRAELIRTVQEEGPGMANAPEEVTRLQWKDTLEKLQSTPPAGRLVIHISGNVKRWANTPADIQLRAGDMLFVPKRSNFVMVDGAVYNPTGIAFRPGRTARWYLKQAGGPTSMANRKNIFVVRADGSVVGGARTMFTGGVLDVALLPGDLIMVPDKAFGGGLKWAETLQIAQTLSSIGVAIAVVLGL